MRKTVFLDRDGLINEKPPEHDYVKCWAGFRFLPGVKEAVKKLNDAGYLVIVVTNQRGVARGLMGMGEVDYIHGRMCAELEKGGARIDAVYVCPHEHGQCTCRKPDIGLFMKAEHDFEIDKPSSWMVGDSKSDMEAGLKYGVKTIYVGADEAGAGDVDCGSLMAASEIILDWDKDLR